MQVFAEGEVIAADADARKRKALQCVDRGRVRDHAGRCNARVAENVVHGAVKSGMKA